MEKMKTFVDKQVEKMTEYFDVKHLLGEGTREEKGDETDDEDGIEVRSDNDEEDNINETIVID